MPSIQDIHSDNYGRDNRREMQENQAKLDQMYGYDPDMMTEQQKAWWEKFLQFIRESRERDAMKMRTQVL
jgi:hypothetical protein